MKMHFGWATALLLGAVCNQADAAAPLLDSDKAVSPASAEFAAISARYAPYTVNAVRQMRWNDSVDLAKAETLEFDLLRGRPLLATLDQLDASQPDRLTWQGHIVGQPGSYVWLSRSAGATTGRIRLPHEGRVFHLTTTPEALSQKSQILVVESSAESAQAEHQAPLIESSLPLPQPSADDTVRKTTVDILFAFTADASAADMNAVAQDLVDESNTVMENSGVAMAWRVAGTYRTSYVQSSTFAAFTEDLRRLGNPADGPLDDVIAERDRIQADAVVLLTARASGTTLGRAISGYTGLPQDALAIAHLASAQTDLTMTHEVGHLMGAHHDDTNSPQPYAFGRGYQMTPCAARTVMANFVANTVRAPHWSNPQIVYQGPANNFCATGTATNDVARVLNLTRVDFARFGQTPISQLVTRKAPLKPNAPWAWPSIFGASLSINWQLAANTAPPESFAIELDRGLTGQFVQMASAASTATNAVVTVTSSRIQRVRVCAVYLMERLCSPASDAFRNFNLTQGVPLAPSFTNLPGATGAMSFEFGINTMPAGPVAASYRVELRAPGDSSYTTLHSALPLVSPDISGQTRFTVNLAGFGTYRVRVSAQNGDGSTSSQFDVVRSAIEPQTGMWWNPSRSGEGYELFRSDNGVWTLYWRTFESGTPVWYVANSTLVNNCFDGGLLRFRRPAGSAVFTQIGSVNVCFSDSRAGSFNWSVGSQSGGYAIQRFDFATPNSPTGSSVGGLYYKPGDSGWGIGGETQAQTHVMMLYAYDASGEPRWTYGVGSGALPATLAMSYVTSNLCPGCNVIPSKTVVPAGSATVHNVYAGGALMDINVQHPAISWFRSAVDLTLIAY